jgi:DNA-binding NarL/FixJ family response regulator
MSRVSSGPVRVVLADDHSVLRAGLRAFLSEQTDPPITVVAEAASAEEAIDLVERHVPDLLLLDLSMPGLGGLGGVAELRRRGRTTPILILTQHAEAVSVQRAMEARANGYILKTARGEDLVSAIRAVVAGGTYVDPTLAGALFAPRGTPASEEEAFAALTPREREILRLIAEGYANKDIADALDIAVKTVMAHRANLMEKLDIHNRSKLVQFAIKVGLLPMDRG